MKKGVTFGDMAKLSPIKIRRGIKVLMPSIVEQPSKRELERIFAKAKSHHVPKRVMEYVDRRVAFEARHPVPRLYDLVLKMQRKGKA